MAALSLVSFAQMQPHAKLSVLQQNTTNSNSDHREIIILRKKLPLNRDKPKLSTTPINNNTTTNNNNVKRENENNNCDSGAKKKPALASKGGGVIRNNQLPTVAVARRNARERNRVQQVNKGFETLRQHIPASVASAFTTAESSGSRGASKKLSKVETLRMAVEYIRSLQQMLASDDPDGTLNEQSVTSPLSLVSTSPAPSTTSQNPSVVPTFASYDDHEASPGVIDDDIHYEDGDSRDSFASTQMSYSRLAPPITYNIYKKKGNYRDELDENFVPLPLFPTNSSTPFLNFMGLRDQKDSDENNMFGYGVSQLTPIHYNPSASLSPGMYSEQSLSPADTETSASRPKFLPAFSQTLRPPLTAMGVESVIQQTYHVMQQMPVKEEVKEDAVAGDGGAVDMAINWWENDERIRTSPA